jgi:transposase-like protein
MQNVPVEHQPAGHRAEHHANSEPLYYGWVGDILLNQRQKFNAELMREAVRLLQTSGKSAAVVARELGIPRNRIYKVGAGCDRQR